jgi:fatty-acid desaturase
MEVLNPHIHTTYCLNSICHTFNKRTYDKSDSDEIIKWTVCKKVIFIHTNKNFINIYKVCQTTLPILE